MKRKLVYAFVTAVITVMSASSFAMSAFAEGESAAAAAIQQQLLRQQAVASDLLSLSCSCSCFSILWLSDLRKSVSRKQEICRTAFRWAMRLSPVAVSLVYKITMTPFLCRSDNGFNTPLSNSSSITFILLILPTVL